MARIMFMVAAHAGHINPFIPIVQHLIDDGHQVCVLRLSSPTFDDRRKAALRGAELPELEVIVDSIAPIGAEADPLPAQIDAIDRELQRWAPDVVAADSILVQAHIASHLRSTPYIAVDTTLLSLMPRELVYEMTTLGRNIDTRTQMLARYGMQDDPAIAGLLSERATIVFTTQEFVDRIAGPDVIQRPAIRLVGPSIGGGPRGDEPSARWSGPAGGGVAYVSLGTYLRRPALFEPVCRAAVSLGLPVVVAAGPDVQAVPTHLEGVHAHAYVPQLEVLSQSRVMVTHAGANSSAEALYHGVPLAMTPLGHEQPIQAMYVARAGAGIVVPAQDADEATWREALRSLVDPHGGAAAAAAAIGRSYRAAQGAAAAARVIVQSI